MLWENSRLRKSSGAEEGQGPDPSPDSELLITGSSPGCSVLCAHQKRTSRLDCPGLSLWLPSTRVGCSSQVTSFIPVSLTHPRARLPTAFHSILQEQISQGTQSELLKIPEGPAVTHEVFIYEDRQRRVAGRLRGVFGSRMTPGESDEPVATEGEIYIRKKTLKKF